MSDGFRALGYSLDTAGAVAVRPLVTALTLPLLPFAKERDIAQGLEPELPTGLHVLELSGIQ